MTETARDRAYAMYQQDGKPRLWPSRVLFFDLLGISAMSTGTRALEHLRRLRPALEEAVERAATEHPDQPQASTWFTDNAVVGAPYAGWQANEELIGGAEVAAAYLLLGCWQSGYLGRGALTYGEHYMDPTFVYGPALIEAVGLEKKARWPRVVLSDEVVKLERQHSEYYADPLCSAQSQCLLRDEDDVVFVDSVGIYIDEEDDPAALDHYLGLQRDATIAGLAEHHAYSAPWLKWRWLADYQNYSLRSRLRDPERYLVPVAEAHAEFASFIDRPGERRPARDGG